MQESPILADIKYYTLYIANFKPKAGVEFLDRFLFIFKSDLKTNLFMC